MHKLHDICGLLFSAAHLIVELSVGTNLRFTQILYNYLGISQQSHQYVTHYVQYSSLLFIFL